MRIILLFSLTTCLTATAGIFDCLPCCHPKPEGVTVDYFRNLSFSPVHQLPAFDIDTIVGALHAEDFTKAIKAVGGHSGNLNQVSTGGELPLVIATRIGHPALVRLLCEAGANPRTRDQDNKSAEQVAQEEDNATLRVQFICLHEIEKAKAQLAQAWKKIAPPESGYLEKPENPMTPDETTSIITECACACDFKTHSFNKLQTLPCGHKIHTTCRLESIKSGFKSCPICNDILSLKAKEEAVQQAAEKLSKLKKQRETNMEGELKAWDELKITEDPEVLLLLAGGNKTLLPKPEIETENYE